MSVSVGINGTVNGGSASSPTGNSTMNINSFPTKENKVKAEAITGQRQESVHETLQLHQKTIQNLQEKVNISSSSLCALFNVTNLLNIYFSLT